MSFKAQIGLDQPSVYISFTTQEGNKITYTSGSDGKGKKISTLPIGDKIVQDQYGRGYTLYRQSPNRYYFGDYIGTALK